MILPDKIYNRAKYVAMIILPAIATLYITLSKIWGFPYGEEIVGTISAINIFLGAVLQISAANYRAANK